MAPKFLHDVNQSKYHTIICKAFLCRKIEKIKRYICLQFFWRRHGSHECSPVLMSVLLCWRAFRFLIFFLALQNISAYSINVASRLLPAFMLTCKGSFEGNYVSEILFPFLSFGAKWRVPFLNFCYGIRNFLVMPIWLYSPALKRMGL